MAQLAPGLDGAQVNTKPVLVTPETFKPVGTEGTVLQTGAADEDEDDLIDEDAEVVGTDDEEMDVVTDDDAPPRRPYT